MPYRTRHATGTDLTKPIGILVFLLIALATGWSQSNCGEPQVGGDVKNQVTRQPDVGPDSESQTVETSPISSPDQSAVEAPPASSRSHLFAGIHGSEGAESDPDWISGDSSQVSSVTNLSGSLSLLKVRRRSESAIDYAGGDTLFSSYGGLELYNQQFHKLNADQTLLWPRGQLAVKDSLYYIGKGDFAASFGGTGAEVPPETGVSSFFGAGQNGIVQEPYITNVSEANVGEALTPRSSAHLAAAYAITDYIGNTESLFNSRQVSGQAGYNYQLSRIAGIGAEYGFQKFEFPVGGVGDLVANSVQLVYRRNLSGRMDLVVGAGPELIGVNGGINGKVQQVTATTQASFRYRWEKSTVNVSYNRLLTAGSGFLAGGLTDTALFSIDRSVSRVWRTALNAGYTKSSGVGLSSAGIPGNSYQNWFAGVEVRRSLGRSLNAFASYQFNDQSLGSCASTGCTPAVSPQVFLIGFDWYIRPVRLE
ncbi:MAG: hypothetical protein WBQ87_14055 [Candidatus Sulfotelmatobacter sp.]